MVDMEPKIIWVLMLTSVTPHKKPLMQAFNKNLARALTNRKGHYLLDVEKKINLSGYLGIFNELTEEGEEKYWEEVNKVIKLFNYQEVSL